ncbi:hypothetical protein KR093_003077, partial [Drosophila rubida]
MMEVCRCCMNDKSQLTHIFKPLQQSQNNHKYVADILNELANCQLILNDALPQFVCNNCIEEAENALSFKRMMERNQKRFRDNLNKRLIKVENRDPELDDIVNMLDIEDLLPLEESKIERLQPAKDNEIKEEKFPVNSHSNPLRRKEENVHTISKTRNTKRVESHPTKVLDTIKNGGCVCPYCNKVVSTKGNLKMHIRTHTGERPYKCTECPKSFVQASTLIVHRRCHTGETPFGCEKCPKAFKQHGNLIAHFR